MTATRQPIQPDQTVGQLASTLSGAPGILHRHGLDSCCGGHPSPWDACSAAGLEVFPVIAEIEEEAKKPGDFERWDDHGQNLERLRELTHDTTPPAEACGTWSALYLGLAELEQRAHGAHPHREQHPLSAHFARLRG